MALTLLDRLMPWRRGRILAFLQGPGDPHAYMVHIGIGWALARLRQRANRLLSRLDPILHWLVLDGIGFHEGYFHPERCIEAQRRPGRIRGYSERVFDQGLGRCLWFAGGADVERVGRMVAAFPYKRRQDLWSGVGLACTYAGGVPQEAVEELRFASGRYLAHAAQGAAFAAKARERAGNPAEHTEMAVRILCGTSARQAAEVTDEALGELASRRDERAYELWRQKIRTLLAFEEVSV